jgi:hypothetical protein
MIGEPTLGLEAYAKSVRRIVNERMSGHLNIKGPLRSQLLRFQSDQIFSYITDSFFSTLNLIIRERRAHHFSTPTFGREVLLTFCGDTKLQEDVDRLGSRIIQRWTDDRGINKKVNSLDTLVLSSFLLTINFLHTLS